MKFIVFLIFVGVIYVASVPIWKDIKTERACFSETQQTIDTADFQVKASILSQNYYCRVTYDAIDGLAGCLSRAQQLLPLWTRKIVPPIVNDIETELQHRTKSLPALKAEHDEICKDYHGYRFEP